MFRAEHHADTGGDRDIDLGVQRWQPVQGAAAAPCGVVDTDSVGAG
jgi:hypothetical protein